MDRLRAQLSEAETLRSNTNRRGEAVRSVVAKYLPDLDVDAFER